MTKNQIQKYWHASHNGNLGVVDLMQWYLFWNTEDICYEYGIWDQEKTLKKSELDIDFLFLSV